MDSHAVSYDGYRFPPEIISQRGLPRERATRMICHAPPRVQGLDRSKAACRKALRWTDDADDDPHPVTLRATLLPARPSIQ